MSDSAVPSTDAQNGPGHARERPQRPRLSLSWKLLALTGLFVIASEVLIYAPSIASYRVSWLKDRLASAAAASIVLTASDWTDVPRELQDQLLATVGAKAIVLRSGGVSRLIAQEEMPVSVDRVTDLRDINPMVSIMEAFDTLVAGGQATLRVIGETPTGTTLELVLADRPLREAMLSYSTAIVALAAIISLIGAAAVYVSLDRLLVRPMRRISHNMVSFAAAPEDPGRVIHPSGRRDEIGVAEEQLAAMQRNLQGTLQQQRHLADLGLAVSKINHDLRNMLASAQLFSDRIGALPDPTVQRFAPKLIATLDRAIAYSQSTLTYGRPGEAAPERRLMRLAPVVQEVAEVLGLDHHPVIRFDNQTPPALEIDADQDQLFRVLVNLCRNAVQALEGEGDSLNPRNLTVEARRDGGVVTIRVRDTGPGVPERARAHLFQAFQGSARPGGTGLGLAIAAELVRAHGGTIRLLEPERPGAVFEIVIPDRPLAFAQRHRA